MRLLLVSAAILASLSMEQQRDVARARPAAVEAAEFPVFDSHVAARQRDGTAINDAIYRLQDEPSEPQTYRALMSIEHFRDALSF